MGPRASQDLRSPSLIMAPDYSHSSLVDAKSMVPTNAQIIGEQVAFNFVAQ